MFSLNKFIKINYLSIIKKTIFLMFINIYTEFVFNKIFGNI